MRCVYVQVDGCMCVLVCVCWGGGYLGSCSGRSFTQASIHNCSAPYSGDDMALAPYPFPGIPHPTPPTITTTER